MDKGYTKIILADDDADDRMFFEEAFEELKMDTKVSTFKDGVYLMDYLNSKEAVIPHILFLDLNMPRKTGMECLTEIRANEKFKDMVVAIYSTSTSEDHIEDAFVIGANVYIKKPNKFSLLKKTLSTVVSTNWQYHKDGMNKDNFLLRL